MARERPEGKTARAGKAVSPFSFISRVLAAPTYETTILSPLNRNNEAMGIKLMFQVYTSDRSDLLFTNSALKRRVSSFSGLFSA